MFIYRVWALFIIASASAASSSSQKTKSVLGASNSTHTKVERCAPVLQYTASQPVPMTSPMSPEAPLVSPATRRVASMYSASAPAGTALAIASPRRFGLPGFGCVINDESELSQSVRVPHLKSTRKGRIDELLQDTQPTIKKEEPLEPQEDTFVSSEESIEAASDLDDYFGAPTESSAKSSDDDNF